MYRVGMSACGFDLSEENFKELRESGIDAIEISMKPHQLENLDYKAVYELSKRYGVELWSFHLPFTPYSFVNTSASDETLRRDTILRFTDYIKKATEIGIKIFIVHPSTEPIPEDEREAYFERSMKTLSELADIAESYGAVIAVEDLPRTCLGNSASEMERLLSANDKLRVCFDVNHLLKDTHRNFAEKLGDKIITLHISDYDFIDERHWLPGEGKIDWTEIADLLDKINYRGVFMYEILLTSTATMTRKRNLTFRDFYLNAKSIFERKEPYRVM